MNVYLEITAFLKWSLFLLPENTKSLVKKILQEFVVLYAETYNSTELEDSEIELLTSSTDESEVVEVLEKMLAKKKNKLLSLTKALD